MAGFDKIMADIPGLADLSAWVTGTPVTSYFGHIVWESFAVSTHHVLETFHLNRTTAFISLYISKPI